jgi:hypothetical protein
MERDLGEKNFLQILPTYNRAGFAGKRFLAKKFYWMVHHVMSVP